MRMHSTCDPLLGTIDRVVFPVLALDGSSPHPLDVRSNERLGNGKTDILLAPETTLDDLLLQFRVRIVEDGRETDDRSGLETIAVPTRLDAREFLVDDHFVKVVEFFGLDDAVEEGSAVQVFTGTHSHGVEVGFAGHKGEGV